MSRGRQLTRVADLLTRLHIVTLFAPFLRHIRSLFIIYLVRYHLNFSCTWCTAGAILRSFPTYPTNLPVSLYSTDASPDLVHTAIIIGGGNLALLVRPTAVSFDSFEKPQRGCATFYLVQMQGCFPDRLDLQIVSHQS